MSPSKDQKESRPADGRDETETFHERATYTTHGEDKDNKSQTDFAYEKAESLARSARLGGFLSFASSAVHIFL